MSEACQNAAGGVYSVVLLSVLSAGTVKWDVWLVCAYVSDGFCLTHVVKLQFEFGATSAVTYEEWHISHCWCNTSCHMWRVTPQSLLVQHMLSHVNSDTSFTVGATHAVTCEEWHISCCSCNTCCHIWRVTHQLPLVQHMLSHVKSDTSVTVGATHAVTYEEWHISHCWCSPCCHIWRVAHLSLLAQNTQTLCTSEDASVETCTSEFFYLHWQTLTFFSYVVFCVRSFSTDQ